MTKVKNKRQYIISGVFVICFIIGICLGALMCAYTGETINKDLQTYLSDFFNQFIGQTDNIAVVKKSMGINSKIFIVIFLSGFLGLGYIASGLCVMTKGFVTGFTMATFIKFYSMEGIWLAVGNIPVNLVLVPAMVFLCVTSTSMSLSQNKKGILGTYIILSIIVYIIFCISALVDGYITTTIMKMIVQNIVK